METKHDTHVLHLLCIFSKKRFHECELIKKNVSRVLKFVLCSTLDWHERQAHHYTEQSPSLLDASYESRRAIVLFFLGRLGARKPRINLDNVLADLKSFVDVLRAK